MLTLRIDLSAPRPYWACTDGRWHGSAGTIQPFTHPCLTRTVHQPRPDSLYVRITSADGDSLTLHARPGTVTLKAGIYATAPLYLALIGSTLHASWDMAEVTQLTEPWQLNDRHIARLLTREHRYSTDTPASTYTG
jgi:asparagine synthase (glutamine-hydrolysing)